MLGPKHLSSLVFGVELLTKRVKMSPFQKDVVLAEKIGSVSCLFVQKKKYFLEM